MSNLFTSSGFKVGVLLCALGAVSPAGGAPPTTPVAKVRSTGLAAQGPARVRQPSQYTEALNCPTSPMTIMIPPESIPAGWKSFPTPINLKRALLEDSQGGQVIWCQYRTSLPDTVIDLRRTVLAAPGSCILNPAKLGFLCKPGSIK